jgi:hypothetical protein
MKSYLEEIAAHRGLICDACSPSWIAEQIAALARIMGQNSQPLVLEFAHERYELQFPLCKSHSASQPHRSSLQWARISRINDFYSNIPTEQGEDERLLDALGYYAPPQGVTGAVVALCWGKIQQSVRRGRIGTAQDLSKVVMIHELAHLVSHLAGRSTTDYWQTFGTSPDLCEIVAQMATEERIEQLEDTEPTLKVTFENLLKGQASCYTAHRAIIAEFKSNGLDPNLVRRLFWAGFLRNRDKPADKPALPQAKSWIETEQTIRKANEEAEQVIRKASEEAGIEVGL